MSPDDPLGAGAAAADLANQPFADDVSGRDDQLVSVEAALDAVPRATALLLRDHIRGLQAEAGTAWGLLSEVERGRDEEVQRLRLHAAGLLAERDTARAERDRAILEADRLHGLVTALRGQSA